MKMLVNMRAFVAITCWSARRPDGRRGVGRITEDVLRKQLPPPGADTVVFLCGPPMMVGALEATLKAIGHREHTIILP